VRVWRRCVKKAGMDAGVDVGERVGKVRMGMEEEEEGEEGEEAGKAGDEGCAPCMLAQVLPLQLQSIWLWPAASCCCLVVTLGGAERGEGWLWEFLG